MVFLKILGMIDLFSAVGFLMLVFGINPPLQYIFFCGGLLFMKGLFVLTGDFFSIFDLIFSIILFLSLLFTIPQVLLWWPAFLLFAKGMWSMF